MMHHFSDLLNAALEAKSYTNSSKSRNYSNCMWIDLKLENLPPTFQRRNNVFFYS